MKKTFVFIIVAVLCTFSANAQYYSDESEGWFVELGTWYVQPDNSMVIGEVDSANLTGGIDIRRFDLTPDEELSWGFSAGYNDYDFGCFSVDYWEYSTSEDYFVQDSNFETLSYLDLYSEYYLNNYWAVDTDAFQAELVWGDNFEGTKKFSGNYFLGIRAFEYKYDMNWSASGGTGLADTASATLRVKSDGIGLCGGVYGDYKINDFISLNCTFDIAAVRGEFDRKYYYRDDLPTVDSDAYSTDSKVFFQYGISAGLDFKIWKNLSGDFGYKFATWEEATSNMNSTVFYKDYVPQVSDVNWSGFYFNLSYVFGVDSTWY